MKEFKLKIESLNQRKQDLEKKEVQLKESVIKFDKFLKVWPTHHYFVWSHFKVEFETKENDAKLSRAVKKTEDERELQKIKQREIERLKEENRLQIKLKDNLTAKVEAFQKFNKYLEQVWRHKLNVLIQLWFKKSIFKDSRILGWVSRN